MAREPSATIRATMPPWRVGHSRSTASPAPRTLPPAGQ